MKNIISILLLFFSVQLSAQDLILLKSTEEINCKVEEVNDVELKYRRADMPDGPLYSVSLDKVFSVKYQSGRIETFNIGSETGDYPYPKVTKRYNIGDLFDEDGVCGIVINVTDNGRHGLIISLKENSSFIPWGSFFQAHERVELFETGARDKDDGWNNMKTISDIIENTELTWNDFPAFNYCRELGEGWYLPAFNEMMMIWNLCNVHKDGSHPLGDYSAWKCMNGVKDTSKKFESNTTTPIFKNSSIRYYTSTEVDYYDIFIIYDKFELKMCERYYSGDKVRKQDKDGKISNKYAELGLLKYRIRAVHKF